MVEGLSTPFASVSYIDSLLFFFSDCDLVFADDERESNPTSFKFMQMAHAWKQAQSGASGTSGTKTSHLLSRLLPRKKNPIRVMMTRAMKLGRTRTTSWMVVTIEDVSSSEDKDKY